VLEEEACGREGRRGGWFLLRVCLRWQTRG
jgi:hypothetical protein